MEMHEDREVPREEMLKKQVEVARDLLANIEKHELEGVVALVHHGKGLVPGADGAVEITAAATNRTLGVCLCSLLELIIQRAEADGVKGDQMEMMQAIAMFFRSMVGIEPDAPQQTSFGAVVN